MVLYDTGDIDSIAYLIENNGVIEEASQAFCGLVHYCADELLGKSMEEILRNMLHVSTDIRFFNEEALIIVFTRHMEARYFTIKKSRDGDSGPLRYVFTVIPRAGFDGKIPFVEKALSDNISGVGIFTIPYYILVKANQTFLNHLPAPFRTAKKAFGKTFDQLLPDFEGGCGGKGWKHLIENSQTIYIKEKEGSHFRQG